MLQDLSHLRAFHTSLSAITAAAFLPSSAVLAVGSYSRSLLLLDPVTGRQAGCLPNIAGTAALSLTAWPAQDATTAAAASTVGPAFAGTAAGSAAGDGSSTSRSVVGTSRDLLAVGDSDGSVRLVQLDTDDTVSVLVG